MNTKNTIPMSALCAAVVLVLVQALFLCPRTAMAASSPVRYRTHVQNVGWQGWRSQGESSGTTGRSLRLEGIQIKLTDGSSISYRTHVQNVGWQGWKKDGAMSGTTGRSLRLEAIQIKLNGAAADRYDVWYRVHAQNIGWMGWAKNGESAGTAGYSYRLEAIQIKLVKKGGAAPGNTARAFTQNLVNYRTHVQNVGWQGWRSQGESSGTTGRSLRLEGIQIKLTDGSSISYRTHVQNIGWQGWKKDGAMSGTTGRSLRLEAIQIKLNGAAADRYDVWYRVHAQNIGWMGWAKNGESAGTAGYSYRLEAIQIKLVKKGGAAPGNTNNVFREKSSPTKRWVAEKGHYEDVYETQKVKTGTRWVVDQEAWDEETYADVTVWYTSDGMRFESVDEAADYCEDQLVNHGVNVSYGSVVENVPTGVVHHDEQGHYEDVYETQKVKTGTRWVVDVPAHWE